MKEEYKKPWIEALRSDKYRQGSTLLYDEKRDTYCCLGVIARINGYNPNAYQDVGTEYLNEELSDKFGLPMSVQLKLACLNDGVFEEDVNPHGEKWPFEKIADYIEANL